MIPLVGTPCLVLLLLGTVLVAWKFDTGPHSRVRSVAHSAALAAAIAKGWDWLFQFVFWRA